MRMIKVAAYSALNDGAEVRQARDYAEKSGLSGTCFSFSRP